MQQNKDGEQKSYRLPGLFSFILLLLLHSLSWASFEDFKRQQDASFAEYRDKRDAAFSQYLKAQWEEYTAKESKPLYENQKPKSVIPTISKEIKSVGPMVTIMLDETPISTDIPSIKPKKAVQKDISFEFFGENLGFDIEPGIKKAKFYPFSQVGITNFFESAASSNYDDLLRDIKTVSSSLSLNDWGIYLLVLEVSKNIFEIDDEANLFTWFLLNKLGYNVKVGLSAKHIVLMHYSKKIIYATPNYRFGDKRFYLLSEYAQKSSKRVYTYKQDYPNAIKPLDLSLKKIPQFSNEMREKNLRFKQHGKEYTIAFNYNKNIIDFMATYPQADYETYFNAPMEYKTYEQIAKEIKQYIDGKKASVAMNFVLNFVQSAFEYERDQDQFGHEKVMFAQETLVYDKSDCEDRATLFAYLVKKLFKVGVIGIKYSDHMTTGLYIPMSGDSIKAGGRKFIIADPTYINANIGQSMPKYKSKIPKSFIVVQNEGA